MAVAESVSEVELDQYQRAVRLLLTEPLITEQHPDADALPLVRRWAVQLSADLRTVLGHRLELGPTSARLVRSLDDLDPSQPARTGTGRPFDRTRYAYLALALAVLGRSAQQLALTELADSVRAEANAVPGLGFDPASAAERNAFVDAVTWLERRGAIQVADGSVASWARDPQAGEALYHLDHAVLTALFKPARVLQHIPGTAALLTRPATHSRDARRRDAALRARRLLVDAPVAYLAEVDADTRANLRTRTVVADVERLTGGTVERRAEGLALIDTTPGQFSDVRFPATGTVAQAALLLLVAIGDRLVDPDAERPPRSPLTTAAERLDGLVTGIDAALPRAGSLHLLADVADPAELELADPDSPADADVRSTPVDVDVRSDPADPDVRSTPADPDEPADDDPTEVVATCPFLDSSWLSATMHDLVAQYGSGFSAEMRADPPRLLAAALDLLTSLRLVEPVESAAGPAAGIRVLPLLARYRNAVVRVRSRQTSLFDLGEGP
jgi:uncharacterized protein (TIGR02678 family)